MTFKNKINNIGKKARTFATNALNKIHGDVVPPMTMLRRSDLQVVPDEDCKQNLPCVTATNLLKYMNENYPSQIAYSRPSGYTIPILPTLPTLPFTYVQSFEESTEKKYSESNSNSNNNNNKKRRINATRTSLNSLHSPLSSSSSTSDNPDKSARSRVNTLKINVNTKNEIFTPILLDTVPPIDELRKSLRGVNRID